MYTNSIQHPYQLGPQMKMLLVLQKKKDCHPVLIFKQAIKSPTYFFP